MCHVIKQSINLYFNYFRLKQASFPVEMLPDVYPSGHVAGVLSHGIVCILAGTPILVSMGDLQCAVFASLQHSTDAGEDTLLLFLIKKCLHF